MFKNTLFTKAVCITTMCAFTFAIAPKSAMAQTRLAPISFNEMYDLAHRGDVEALRASMYRGMSIDSTNSRGDTGLCLAARRRDVHAYNSFVAAGANPRHPCTQNVSGYSSFVSRSDVIGGGSGSQNGAAVMANSRNGDRIAPIWWWIGGAAVTGAIIWLLLGGSHGGGGDSEDSEAYISLGRNVAANGVAMKTTSGVMNNDLLLRHTNSNIEKIVDIDLKKSLDNTTYMDAILYTKGGGTYTNNEGIMLETGAGTVAMNAIEKSYMSNLGYIKVDSYNASVGMVSSEGSSAINYGTGLIEGICSDGIALNFSGYKDNDTIVGMYADTAASISNMGDIKGTAIEAVTDPLANKESTESASSSNSSILDSVGLSDSSSSDTESSTSESINTTAASTGGTASVGTMIGMEALIVNMGNNLNKDTIKVSNGKDAKIMLTAGDSGASENQIKVSLVGMGSYLHNDFLNGSFSLKRAENVSITNTGVIDLSYSGNYTSSSATALRKGLGGIIGIRADANTKATNRGEIDITLYDEYKTEGVEVSAGMQSVHGGNITNAGDINISTPSENARINYGMVAVEGTGSNSSLYTNMNPSVINDENGNINIQIANSYGMASYVGGTLKNAGTITLGSPETRFYNNIAMYGFGDTKRTDMINTGTIDVYSHKSMAMQNDYSGGTDITNDGTINIHSSATDSYVFGGAYSKIYNKGIINYDANATYNGEISKEGETYNPFKYYELAYGSSVISTQARTLKDENTDFSSSTTEAIYNEEGAEINMNGASYMAAMAVEANEGAENTQAQAINNGTINIKDSNAENATNTIGMYMDSKTLSNAAIINNGTIHTDSNFSVAMLSESQQNAIVTNNGTIQADHENSVGMYATDYSNMRNNKDILMNGKNSIGVYMGWPSDDDDTPNGNLLSVKFVNGSDARIVIGGEDNFAENSFGIYTQAYLHNLGNVLAAQIENNGIIDLYTTSAGAAIYAQSYKGKITNNKNINIYGDKAYGIYTAYENEIINNTDGVITIGTKDKPTSGSIGIMNEGAGTKITNKGDIDLYNNSNGEEGYAIYSTGANTEIKNEQGADIYLHNGRSTGIYSEGGTVNNDSIINIENNDSSAIKIAKDATATNDSHGVINVGSASQGVNNSNGIVSLDEATGGITNKGEINLYNGDIGKGNSHAILAGGNNVTVTNERYGRINSYNDNSDIIRATGIINVINNGEIYGEGNNVTAIQGYDEEGKTASKITVENTVTGKITIGEEGTTDIEGYGIEANDINTVTNRGKITVHNKGGYGISAQTGTSIVNDDPVKKYDAKIKMTGEDSVGIYGGAVADVTNNGVIETFARNNKAISTSTLNEQGEQEESAQTVTNTGDLIMHNANQSYGIYSLGANKIISKNTGTIVLGYDEDGNPTEENAKDGYGIYAEQATSITNDSQIKIYASGNGITGGQTITNGGNIYLHGDASKGISSNGTTVINSGKIKIDGPNHSYGIYTKPQTDGETSTTVSVTNNEGADIIIGTDDNRGAFGFGIYAPNGSTITNNAGIEIYATNSDGITGGDTITNTGAIHITGQDSKGITSNGTEITNEGAITIDHSQNSYGIYTQHDTNTPIITNSSDAKITIGSTDDCTAGNINCASNGHGIYSEKASSITNYADIEVYAKQATGITGGTSIINYSNNGKSGAIHIVGRQSKGIYGNKDNTSIYNEGKINVDDANGSYGIHADDNAATSVQNMTSNAKITIGTESSTDTEDSIGTSAHGIYAVKSSSITNEADITVYAQGDSTTGVEDSLNYLPLKASGITGGVSITNDGVIRITGGEAHGIYGAVNNTSITSHNNILIDKANYSYGIRTANTAATTITNEPTKQHDNLKIVVGNEDETGLSSHGIFSVGANSIDNDAAITVYAKGTDIPVYGDDDALDRLVYKSSGITGGVSITNTGVIHVSGGKDIKTDGKVHGIYGAANNTKITNSNNIKIDVANFSFGIRAYKTATTTISNTGNQLTIIVGKTDEQGNFDDDVAANVGLSSHGIFALAAESIINEAAITVLAQGQDYTTSGSDDSPDVLMYKTSGITGGKSINNSGVIYLTGGKAHGIYGTISNTSIINSNRIRIKYAQDSYGIRTSDSAQTSITNEGDDLSIMIGTEGKTENQTNAHGIYSKNADTITNQADIDIVAKESSGITGGKTITNKGKIHITGQDSKGIESDNATKIDNYKSITIDSATNSYGIYAGAAANAEITNYSEGEISIGAKTAGTNAHGIYATGAQKIDNDAKIAIWSDRASGITGGVEIDNSGDIHILRNGTNDVGQNKGIEGANKNTNKIDNSGKITIDNAQSSYGIYTVDSAAPTIDNSDTGVITIGTENGDNPANYASITDGHGIYSANATKITNDALIYVYASGDKSTASSGITGGQEVENNGSILITGNYGHGIETRGTKITNTAPITIYGPDGSAGIYSTGDDVTISNTKSATQTPNISIGSNTYRGTKISYGIYADNATSVTNDGTISVYSDDSYGIYSKTGNTQTVTNNGAIYMAEDRATGIYTSGSSTITNKKSITLDIAQDAYGIRSEGADSSTSSITNTEDGDILIGKAAVTTATGAYGIYLYKGGDVENDGDIKIYASESYGIYVVNGNKITNNAPIEMPFGDKSVGIFSAGSVTIDNKGKGEITIGGNIAGSNSHGIKAMSANGITNAAPITVYSTGDSTAISGGGAIINSGELYVSGPRAKGIYSVDSSGGEGSEGSSSVTNTNNITIPDGNNSYGIYATGNVTLNNSGDIEVGSESVGQNSAAIYTVKGENLTNSGNLTIHAQNPAWGIYGGAVKKLTNTGNIYMDQKTGIIGIYTNGETTIDNQGNITLDYADNNYGIKADIGPASVTNSGIINIGNSTNHTDDEYAYGIYVDKGSSITNSNQINVYASKSAGIYLASSASGEGGGSDSGSSTITNNGPITLPYGQESSGIYTNAVNVTINNNDAGTIIIGATTPGRLENGIYAPKSAKLTSSAPNITLYGQGTAITGHNQINNSSILTIDQSGITDNEKRASVGISADGDSVTNEKPAKILIAYSNGSIGILATGDTDVTNKEADITIGTKEENVTNGTAAYGIRATKGKSIDNSGNITVNASQSYGIYSQNATKISNSGLIKLPFAEETGIMSLGGSAQITNSNAITLAYYATNGSISESVKNTYGIRSLGSQSAITNEINGSITIGSANNFATLSNTTSAYGIYVSNGTSLQNDASIRIYADNSYGIWVDSTATVTNGGTIDVTGGNHSSGIYSNSGNTQITNTKAIKVASNTSTDASNSSGIFSSAGTAKVTNSGSIIVGHTATTTDSYEPLTGGTYKNISGLYGINISRGTVENTDANITLYGKGVAIEGHQAETVTNTNGSLDVYGVGMGIRTDSGNITNDGAITMHDEAKDQPSYGIYTNTVSTGATVVNGQNGRIEVGVEENANKTYTDDTGEEYVISSYGIRATNSTNVTNNGVITLKSNGNAILNAKDVTNTGTISIAGKGDAIVAQGAITNESGSITTNDGIIVRNAQSFTNSGTIVANLYNKGQTTTDEQKRIYTGAIHNVKTVSNDTAGKITNYNGPVIFGASTVTNSGDLTGWHTGRKQVICETDTDGNCKLDDDGNPIPVKIQDSQGTEVDVEMYIGGVIYNRGATTITNDGNITAKGEGSGIYVVVPSNQTNVTIQNSGTIAIDSEVGKTTEGVDSYAAIHVIKMYAFYVAARDENGNVIAWDPEADHTTIDPGDASTWFCITLRDGTINCSAKGPITEDGPNWEPRVPVKQATQSASRIAAPVRLMSGETLALASVDDENSTQATESSENTSNETSESSETTEKTVSAAQNSLIWVNDPELLKSIVVRNSGTIITGGDVNFGNADENSAFITVGDGGSYEAKTFTGTLRAEPSIVQGGYETTYVNEDTLVGEDKGVEFVSESYMFDASSQQNEDGNTDVVMTMKPFSETVDDTQISDYLAQNYDNRHGEIVFDVLKTASTKDQLYNFTRRELGFTFVPNLAKQSLDIEQTVGRKANDELSDIDGNKDRAVVETVSYKSGFDSKGEVIGYSDQVEAVYGFMDKDYDNGMRLGFGLEAIRADSDFDDGSNRYNNMIEVFTPIIFNEDYLTALIKPKAGFARGHYRRVSTADTHKANTKEYYYGVDAAIKQNYDLGWFEVEPAAEMDVTGVLIDDIHESNDGLRLKDRDVISAQSILSLEAKKHIKLGSQSSVSLGAGGKYIHEFGDNYHAKASVSDMMGYYDIISNRIVRNYGLLNMKAQFDYRDLTLDASANMPMDDKQKTFYMFNAKYKF